MRIEVKVNMTASLNEINELKDKLSTPIQSPVTVILALVQQ